MKGSNTLCKPWGSALPLRLGWGLACHYKHFWLICDAMQQGNTWSHYQTHIPRYRIEECVAYRLPMHQTYMNECMELPCLQAAKVLQAGLQPKPWHGSQKWTMHGGKQLYEVYKSSMMIISGLLHTCMHKMTMFVSNNHAGIFSTIQLYMVLTCVGIMGLAIDQWLSWIWWIN